MLTVPKPEHALALYLSGEDALLVTAFNALAGVTLRLSGRFLPTQADPTQPAPAVAPFDRTFVPATDRSASTLVHGLGEGWLLEASVSASVASPAIGQCFVKLEIQRGLAAGGLVLSILARGYASSKQRVAYPALGDSSSVDGGGVIRAIVGTAPAAGAEVVETVPVGARWELLSFNAVLTTAVAAANRVVAFVLDDGANLLYDISVAQNQAASLVGIYSFAQGVPLFADAARLVFGAPAPVNNRLPAGARIRTSTLAIQAADQYATPKYLVREWIEGA